MQEKIKKIGNEGLTHLIIKISRLRKKLISYGFSDEESHAIILYEFLKLPMIDWSQIENTVSFYEIKEMHGVDSSTAQLLTSLQEIVPNLQTEDVLNYLLSVLEYNSIAFGFELADSSSESNDIPQIKKLRTKISAKRKKTDKKHLFKPKQFDSCPKKKNHLEQFGDEKNSWTMFGVEGENEEKNQVISKEGKGGDSKSVRRRKPVTEYAEMEESLEKKIKKEGE